MPLDLSILDVNLRHITQVSDAQAQAHLAQLQARAQAGDGLAEAALGRLYLEGWRVPRDEQRARQHFENGANLGNAVAQNSLGVLLRDGQAANAQTQGAAQPDLAAAQLWFSRAAEQQLPEALFNLASLLWTASASTDAVQRCLGWMRRAAEADLLIAQAELGRQLGGFGALPADLCDAAQAGHWLTQAAQRGDAGAQHHLGLLLLGGFGGAPVNVLNHAGDAAAARPWFQRAALQGHAHAQLMCGNLAYFGVATPAQPARGVRWFRRAAQQGLADAQHNLGVALYEGKGAPRDFDQARQWFALAAQQDHADALNNLGVMALHGEGGPMDWDEAGQAMQRAAHLGISGAQHGWAQLLWARALRASQVGDAVQAQADCQDALRWCEQAASHELEPEPQAQLDLALWLCMKPEPMQPAAQAAGGQACVSDQAQAVQWLHRALQTQTPCDLQQLAQDNWLSVQRAGPEPAASAFSAWPIVLAQSGWFAACVAQGLPSAAGEESQAGGQPARDAAGLQGLRAALGEAQAHSVASCAQRVLAALGSRALSPLLTGAAGFAPGAGH